MGNTAMPTLFKRRYMREGPGPRERYIGPALLVLTLLIAGLFLLTSGLLGGKIDESRPAVAARKMLGITDQAPLFTVRAENRPPAGPPHAVRVAGTLLPVLSDPWQRGAVQATTQPAAAAAPGEADALLAALEHFDPRALYAAAYKAADARVQARIVDAGDPPDAFGLARLRRPKDARKLNLGREGWMAADGSRLGFWAGRYYTELAAEKLEPQAFEQLARQLGAAQVVYGGPFWAEPVLPAEGRTAESFRFVRRAGLGLAGLDECWLADYQDGTTIAVARPAKPATLMDAVRKAFESAPAANAEQSESAEVQPASEEESADSSEQAHRGGETGEGSVTAESTEQAYGDHAGSEPGGTASQPATALPAGGVAGRIGDRFAAALIAGPYVFVIVSPKAEAIGPQAAALGERFKDTGREPRTIVAGPTPDAAGPVAAGGSARFPDVPGTRLIRPTRIERYAENLYEKIDGKEGIFRDFGIIDLRFGQYADPDRQQSYDLYVYDMAEPANALGIYMMERPETAAPVQLGRGAYNSGTSVFFWKGQYYVNVLGPAGDASVLETSSKLAAAVADTIADDGRPFWAEELLPKEEQAPHSLAYRANNGLGFAFIKQMFTARYAVGEQTYQMFIVKAADAAAARQLYDRYADATGKLDKVVSNEPSPGGATMVIDSAGQFGCAFCRGLYFGGVTRADDQQLALDRAVRLRDKLPAE